MQMGKRECARRFITAEALESRRLMAAGDLDKTFSGDGLLGTQVGSLTSGATDVAVQSDGKIIAVGAAGMVRYNSDGTLDTTFGPAHTGKISGIGFNRVAIQSDQKIVLLGQESPNVADRDYEMVAYRYLPNGTPDTSFDGDGKFVYTWSTHEAATFRPPFTKGAYRGREILFQRDGKIIVVGSLVFGTYIDVDEDFAVLRLNTNGTLDHTFGEIVSTSPTTIRSGYRFLGFGEDDDANAAAIDYNGTAATNPYYGSIVVVGAALGKYSSTFGQMGIARVTPNGDADTSFSSDGKVVYSSAGYTYSKGTGVVIQSGGRIVVAETIWNQNSSNVVTASRIALTRITATGALDTGFGGSGAGRIIVPFGTIDGANDLLTSFGGKFLVGGYSDGNFALAAVTPDGVIDTTFSGDGKVTTNIGGNDSIEALALYPGNRVVAAGTFNPSLPYFAVARYFDVGPTVSISSLDPGASEPGTNTATAIVYRSAYLNTTTRVYYTVGGTASAPGTLPTTAQDYTGVPSAVASRYVDILPGANFATIVITPKDDTRVEGNETVIITVLPDTGNAYTLGSSNSVTLVIADNDGTTNQPITLGASADAYVRDGAPGTNFGTAADLQVKNVAGLARETYLKFDLSTVATITTAKLRLYGNVAGPSSTNVAVGVYSATDTTWGETTINYNNRPAASATALATTNIINATPSWYEWDITAYLKAQKAAGHNLVTLVIKATAASSDYITFASKEAAANKPQVVIT